MSRIEAAANSISESSGMRFDGFWSRIEDLEPEDREYALREASAALAASDAHDAANGVHRLTLDEGTVERAARVMHPEAWQDSWIEFNPEGCRRAREEARAKTHRVLAAAVKEDG